jgi:hypothetical protein
MLPSMSYSSSCPLPRCLHRSPCARVLPPNKNRLEGCPIRRLSAEWEVFAECYNHETSHLSELRPGPRPDDTGSGAGEIGESQSSFESISRTRQTGHHEKLVQRHPANRLSRFQSRSRLASRAAIAPPCSLRGWRLPIPPHSSGRLSRTFSSCSATDCAFCICVM